MRGLLWSSTLVSSSLLLFGPAGVSAAPAEIRANKIGTSVSLDYGTFHGSSGSQYTSFKGIKYADAPRFEGPVFPPQKHLGDVDAKSFNKGCLMANKNSPGNTMSEDCLFVNVFVPKGTKSDAKLPVVAWFHGGGFISGNSHSNTPEALMKASDKPFIFVSVDYRLGPFGFLAGKEVKKSGGANIGLHDQRASLRWINKYIKNFGGDPDQVTIWGQSAGAASIVYHLVLKNGDNQGLFQRAIGDSPSGNYQPEVDDDYVQQLFDDFAKNAGCSGSDPLACLKKASVDKLMKASVKTTSSRSPTLYPWSPSIDGHFFTKRASPALSSGQFAQVPMLFGANTDDGADWAKSVEKSGATTDTVYDFMKGQFPKLSKSLFEKAMNHYPLKNYDNSLSYLTRAMYGESRYICTSLGVAGAAQAKGLNSWSYIYDKEDSSGLVRHTAELKALYNSGASASTDNGMDFKMRDYWTSFITGGSPGSDWKKVSHSTGSSRLYLSPSSVTNKDIDSGLEDRCEFWRAADDQLER